VIKFSAPNATRKNVEGGKRKGVGEVREGQGQAEVVQFKKFFYKYNTIQINF